jgi:hypothetical protein
MTDIRNIEQDRNLPGGNEISLLDIVNFLQESWKKLALAGLIGAILGFAYWNFLGSYLRYVYKRLEYGSKK